jgi:DNA-binding NarL/FixJ family response regulator
MAHRVRPRQCTSAVRVCAVTRILIADDHETVRKGVRSILESRKDVEKCYEASNGEEAVRDALELKPDLIILDLSMPGLDGLAAGKEIRKLLPNIPILMLSMHAGDGIVREAQKAGLHGFVSKGDAGQVLLRAVDALLKGQTFFK